MMTGFEQYTRKTRRAIFLEEMEQVVPWRELCALVEPHYPKPGNGRPPVGVERMLRIYFLQQWFNLSDPAVEEALYDSAVMRQFVGVDLGREPAPDETTVCKFRHLLEAHHLGEQILGRVNLHLQAQGVRITTGTIVDATILHCCSHQLSPAAKVADHGPATEAGRDDGKNRFRTLALAWLNTQNFKDTGLFRVSLGQKCNSSRIRDQECMEAAANYEHCGSSSLKRAGLSYPRERFDCNGLVFRILSSLPPTPSASQRLHLRAPTHNQVNRVFSLKKMRNRDALSFRGCEGTSDAVDDRH